MQLRRKRVIVIVGIVLIFGLLCWLLQAGLTDPIDSYTSCATAGYQTFDTNPLSCSDGEHTFLGPYLSPLPSEPPVNSVGFQILVDGDSKGKYPQSQVVITNEADWVNYWDHVHAWLPQIPPLLPVDFSQYNVVAVNLGQEATSGYGDEVTEVTTSSVGTVVDVNETVPDTKCKVQSVDTNPYYIVETPVLPTPVSFRITTTKREC